MIVYGIDFTSRPTRRKPIVCLACDFHDNHLEARDLLEWPSFADFESALKRAGPWIAGIDFPFGQARRFIDTIGWPQSWAGYVDHVDRMNREEFRSLLDSYRRQRPRGDKEHRRKADVGAGSISPQKLYGTPVGLMFYEGAPRLKKSGVTIPLLHKGDPRRIVLEAYPGILARELIGRRSYKQDSKAKVSADQFGARVDLLHAITRGAVRSTHGVTVDAPDALAEDPGGDRLDALLCAIQAAWAYTQRNDDYGAPSAIDPLEGWIAHPPLVVNDTT